MSNGRKHERALKLLEEKKIRVDLEAERLQGSINKLTAELATVQTSAEEIQAAIERLVSDILAAGEGGK